LRTVLVNVLHNAAQAVRADQGAEGGAAGSARASIEIRTTPRAEGGVIVVVHDEGPGIDPAVAARLFEPFFTTRRGGTGLGLAIARNIVDGLGGTITISAGTPSGTDVRLTLPAAPEGEAGDGRS
jgi:two-component system sensor kinase FixL